MEKVAIPKNWLIGLVATLALAVICIAFLLGRESAHGRSSEPSPRPPAQTSITPRAALPEPKGDGSESAEVAAYFQRIQEIQVGQGSGSPQEYASTLLTAAVSGDSSGFAGLAASLGEAERRARALTPPSPCTQYHQTMIALLGQSKNMLTKMKDALDRKDANALSEAAGAAGALQSQTEALETEEKRLKAIYHLP